MTIPRIVCSVFGHSNESRRAEKRLFQLEYTHYISALRHIYDSSRFVYSGQHGRYLALHIREAPDRG